MKQYVTADLHINHKNIIQYCNRPFKDVPTMNIKLIGNINERCKHEDVLYNLGDFKFARSTQTDLHMPKPEENINAKVIHIRGNHDRNNNTKGLLDYAAISFANKKWLLCHIPPTSKDFNKKYFDLTFLLHHVDCVLCGHVHQHWKHRWYEDDFVKLPIINVGVDVWKFRPISMDEVNVYYNRIKNENNNS